MPNNISNVFTLLEKAEGQIEDAVATLDNLSKTALQFNGEVSRVIPLHMQKNIEILTKLLIGRDQNALANVKEWIDSIPTGQWREKRREIGEEFDYAVTDDGVDVTPDTSSGPQSAVLQDSILDKYLKRSPKLQEKEHRLKLELTFDDDVIGNDIDLQDVAEEDNASAYSLDDLDDENEYIDDEDDSPVDWQGLAGDDGDEEDPAGLSFKSILNNGEIGAGDDDLLGEMGAFNAKNDIPVEPMQRQPYRAASLDNSDSFVPENDDSEPEDNLGDFDGSGDDFSMDDDGEDMFTGAPKSGPQAIKAPAPKQTLAGSAPVNWKSLVKADDDISFGKIAGAN